MSTIYYREANKPRSQQLRRDMTPQERHLWYDFLRGLPIQVRRQKAFGNYIADFYCAERNLVIKRTARSIIRKKPRNMTAGEMTIWSVWG